MYPDHPGRTVPVAVQKVRNGERRQVEDAVAAEEPLEIRVAPHGQPAVSVSVTMRTPGNDFELAVGFLLTEGVIHEASDIEAIAYAADALPERQYNVVEVRLAAGASFDPARLSRNFYTTSSCGVCGKASLDALHFQGCRPLVGDGFVVPDATLRSLPTNLRQAQHLFAETGGLHAAGLFTGAGDLLVLREDVGRHNAVDKLVGERLLAGQLPLSGHILMLSGRASFELVQKAVVAGVPLICAVGAPSSLAVDTAREYGVTLVGFLRADGFNIYTGPERINLEPRSTDLHGERERPSSA
jgi:FdhD protein